MTQRDGETEKWKYREMERQRDRKTVRQNDGETEKWRDRMMVRQRDGETE